MRYGRPDIIPYASTIPNWSSTDYATLASLSAAQSPPIDPAQVALVLFEESGMNPASPGPAGASVGGLNQVSTANLTALGITRADWLSMTPSEQLPTIFKWWDSLANSDNGGQFPADGGTLLALNFLPGAFKTVGAGSNENAVLAAAAGPYASYYIANSSLDPNNTGSITPATCQTRLNNVASAAGSTWQSILSNIQAVSSYSTAVASNPWSSALVALAGGLALGGAAFLVAERAREFRPARARRRAYI